jgi:hypothetical protein
MPGLLDVDWTFTYTGISRTVALRCDAVAVAVDPQPRDRRQRGLQLRDSRGCAAYEGRGQARMEMGSEHREVVPIIGADGGCVHYSSHPDRILAASARWETSDTRTSRPPFRT